MAERLYTPGPVEIPDRVLAALALRPPHHRSAAFQDLLAKLNPRLRALFGTSGKVLILASSGTGGMDAAASNFVRPGDRTLVLSAGKFGERWEKILRAYGHQPRVLRADFGKTIRPEELAAALDEESADAVFITHSETSTGTLHDLRALAHEAKRRGAMVIADAITSIGVHEFRQDDFGVDVAVGGSQKGLMLPPGLALVGIGPDALEKLTTNPPASHSFYLDLRRAAESANTDDTPFTPAVSLIIALDEAVRMIEEVGLEAVWDQHEKIAGGVRAGALAIGFTLLSERPANSVTALFPPDGISAKDVSDYLKKNFGFQLAGGQDHLKGKIIRVGTMGLAYGPEDAVRVSEALEEAVVHLGGTAERGQARVAVEQSL